MTGREVIPIAPPGLGEVLASPSAYAEAMIAGQTLPFPAWAPVPRAGRELVRGASAHQARHRRPSRRGGVIRRALGASLVVAAIGGSIAAAMPGNAPHAFYGVTPAQLAASVVQVPAVAVDTPVVHGRGYVKLTARFSGCVRDVVAYVTSGDDGPDNTRSNRIDASEARPGTVFTVYVSVSAADAQAMPGTWSVTSVQARACGTGNPVALYWPNPVFQVTS